MAKAKALIIIMSGSENPSRVLMGLRFAWLTKNAGAFEDVRVVFFGPSEAYIAKTEDKDTLEAYNKVLENCIAVQACIRIADKEGISSALLDKNMELASVGLTIPEFMAEGYHTLTF